MNKTDERKFERRAAIAKAMAHPMRLKILEFLHDRGTTCVCELVGAFECLQPIVSKHLTILKNAGLVSLRKEGLKVYYSLKTPCILTFFECADRVFDNHKKSL